jgi:hypothetical protein
MGNTKSSNLGMNKPNSPDFWEGTSVNTWPIKRLGMNEPNCEIKLNTKVEFFNGSVNEAAELYYKQNDRVCILDDKIQKLELMSTKLYLSKLGELYKEIDGLNNIVEFPRVKIDSNSSGNELDDKNKYYTYVIVAKAPDNESKPIENALQSKDKIINIIRNILSLAGCFIVESFDGPTNVKKGPTNVKKNTVEKYNVLVIGDWGYGDYCDYHSKRRDYLQYATMIADAFQEVLSTSKTKLKKICFAIEKSDVYDIFKSRGWTNPTQEKTKTVSPMSPTLPSRSFTLLPRSFTPPSRSSTPLPRSSTPPLKPRSSTPLPRSSTPPLKPRSSTPPLKPRSSTPIPPSAASRLFEFSTPSASIPTSISPSVTLASPRQLKTVSTKPLLHNRIKKIISDSIKTRIQSVQIGGYKKSRKLKLNRNKMSRKSNKMSRKSNKMSRKSKTNK